MIVLLHVFLSLACDFLLIPKFVVVLLWILTDNDLQLLYITVMACSKACHFSLLEQYLLVVVSWQHRELL
jgi:hypothetical protein